MRKTMLALALAGASLGLHAPAKADEGHIRNAPQLAAWDAEHQGPDWCRANWQAGSGGKLTKAQRNQWKWCLANGGRWQPMRAQGNGWGAVQQQNSDNSDWCRENWRAGVNGAFAHKHQDDWNWCLEHRGSWAGGQTLADNSDNAKWCRNNWQKGMNGGFQHEHQDDWNWCLNHRNSWANNGLAKVKDNDDDDNISAVNWCRTNWKAGVQGAFQNAHQDDWAWCRRNADEWRPMGYNGIQWTNWRKQNHWD